MNMDFLSIESRVKSQLEGVMLIIKEYEYRMNDENANHSIIIKDKDEQIKILMEIRDKQKEEMEDFLKVSFASKWKKQCEEAIAKLSHLEIKFENLQRINIELNHRLDQFSKQETVETQTDQIHEFCEDKKINEKLEKSNKSTQKKNRELTKLNKELQQRIIELENQDPTSNNNHNEDLQEKIVLQEKIDLLENKLDEITKLNKEELQDNFINPENIIDNNNIILSNRITELEHKLANVSYEMTIKTQKGAIYILKNDTLEKDGKIVGKVTEKTLI